MKISDAQRNTSSLERSFECAWFFEDDLVLSPVYFQMMERLQNFAASVGNVAYFAAYGNHYAPPEEVMERRRETATLDHHWGFGVLGRHWRALQPQLSDFYGVVNGSDYSRRDHRRIFAIYEKYSTSPRASSQDAAKAFACNQLGLWRCNTAVPFAKYIGAIGQHMTPEMFKDLGFDRIDVAQAPVLDLDFPGPSGIRERVLEQRQLFEEVRRDEFTEIIQGLPPKRLNPMRLCSRSEIAFAYQLLLRRSVESEDIFRLHADVRPVQVLISALCRSNEFSRLIDETADVFTFRDATSRRHCTIQDIHNIYVLLCHREPEEDKFRQHEGKTPVDLLIEGVFRSSEFRVLNEQFEQ